MFDGVDLTRRDVAAEARGRRIGYVPQEPISNLDPSFTVGSQLIEPLQSVLNVSKKRAIAARSISWPESASTTQTDLPLVPP